MLIRMRWFTFGAVASLGALAYAANQLRRMRERLTPENLVREAGRSISQGLDAVARRLTPNDPGE